MNTRLITCSKDNIATTKQRTKKIGMITKYSVEVSGDKIGCQQDWYAGKNKTKLVAESF